MLLLLETPAQLVYPFVWMFIVDEVIRTGSLGLLLPATGVWIASQMLAQTLRVGRSYLSYRLGHSYAKTARAEIHEAVVLMPWADHPNFQSGDFTSRFGSDTDVVERFLAQDLPAIIIHSASFFVIVGVLLG